MLTKAVCFCLVEFNSYKYNFFLNLGCYIPQMKTNWVVSIHCQGRPMYYYKISKVVWGGGLEYPFKVIETMADVRHLGEWRSSWICLS